MGTIEQQFSECKKIMAFELMVLNKRTDEIEYLLFNLTISNNEIRANRVPLTEGEESGFFITYERVVIEENFSLDQHLQALYERCVDAIIASPFYALAEE